MTLRREPNNPHDRNAVAVLRASNGLQLGYLGLENAEWIAEVLDRGQTVTASIQSIGLAETERGKLLGAMITIEKAAI